MSGRPIASAEWACGVVGQGGLTAGSTVHSSMKNMLEEKPITFD